MRKTIIIGFLAVFVLFLTYGISDTAVTGVCYHCHTMHNSQGGSGEAYIYTAGTKSLSPNPLSLLLKGDCLACHTSTTTATIDPTTHAPIVYNTGGYPTGAKGTTSAPLAGGNFFGTTDATRHNVDFVAGQDAVLGNKPPGTTTALASQLTCAGATGCHGDRSQSTNYLAIKGAHHSNVTGTVDGTTVGKSYRFLNGITGVEDTDWEQSASSTDHNGYKGYSNSFTDTTTISYLCGECHGDFHSSAGVGSASPWLRHPTDVTLAALGTDYTTYDIDVPVALSTPSATSSTVDSTSIVICLSCHNAHGTLNNDILKWAYDSSAGSGLTTKCLKCHLKQR
jgi:hypothetical protein